MEITQITIKRANGDEWQLSVEEARELRGQLDELLGVRQSTTWVYPTYPQYPVLRTGTGDWTPDLRTTTTATAHPDPDGIGKRIAVTANLGGDKCKWNLSPGFMQPALSVLEQPQGEN